MKLTPPHPFKRWFASAPALRLLLLLHLLLGLGCAPQPAPSPDGRSTKGPNVLPAPVALWGTNEGQISAHSAFLLPAEPCTWALATGQPSVSQWEDLFRNTADHKLRDRLLESVASVGEGALLWPTQPLPPGLVSVACAERRKSYSFLVEKAPQLPVLSPVGWAELGDERRLLYCDRRLESVHGVSAAFGDLSPLEGFGSCLQWRGRHTAGPKALLSGGGQPLVWLDPSPEQPPVAAAGPPCGGMQTGSLCVVGNAGGLQLRNGSPSHSALVSWSNGTQWLAPLEEVELPPLDTEHPVTAQLWPDGRTFVLNVPQLSPGPRLRITELYANPLGPEPQGEWVELSNEGSEDIWLEGYKLGDGSGPFYEIPARTLEAHSRALLLRMDFGSAPDDPAIAADCLVLPMKQLASYGIRNSGEPVILLDPNGKLHHKVVPSAPFDEGRSVGLSAGGYLIPQKTPSPCGPNTNG